MADDTRPRKWQLALHVGDPGRAKISRRMAGALTASYQWFEGHEGDEHFKHYVGPVPVPMHRGDYLSFIIPKRPFLEGPRLRIYFRPFDGPFPVSPFDRETMLELRRGLLPTGTLGRTDSLFFEYGQLELRHAGQEFQFLAEIQDRQGGRSTLWAIDPQMDVEGDI